MKKRKKEYSTVILDCLKDLNDICKNKKVFFYGAGLFAQEFFQHFDLEKLGIQGFIDGNEAKKGSSINGCKIYHTSEIKDLNPDLLIITATYHEPIVKSLEVLKQENNLKFEIQNNLFENFDRNLYEKDFRFIDFDEAKKFKYIEKAHFRHPVDEQTAKRIFKNSVQIYEMEVFSFCNRKCWFCPNSKIDRVSKNHIMPEETFLKVVKELSEIDYNNIFTFTRYSEPLANELIYTRIKQARKLLPNAQLRLNSNGDYLNENTLEKLYQAGLDLIEIQVYPKEKGYNADYIKENIKTKTKKMGLEFDPKNTQEIKGSQVWLNLLYKKNMQVSIIGRNFDKMLLSRGGFLKEHFDENTLRYEPCYAQFVGVMVDYNGNVMPCCNLRSDLEEHQCFILGNINDNTIFEVYTSKENSDYRKMFMTYNKKPPMCENCFHVVGMVEDSPQMREKFEEIRKNLIVG